MITASASIYAKYIIDGEYFITLINETDTQKFVKMKCDKSTYDKLIADENVQYQIEYRLVLWMRERAVYTTLMLITILITDNKKRSVFHSAFLMSITF